MSKIWITSDTHFNHDKDFIYIPRGYTNIHDMNKDLIQKWNSVVESDDTVYHLGDVMLGNLDDGLEILRNLKGIIYIIRGNHDTNKRANAYFYNTTNVMDVLYAEVIKHNKHHLYLSHYPTLCSNYDDYKRTATINLCGHSHTTDRFADMDKGLIYHCEVDAHNGFPVCLDDIIEEIKERKSK